MAQQALRHNASASMEPAPPPKKKKKAAVHNEPHAHENAQKHAARLPLTGHRRGKKHTAAAAAAVEKATKTTVGKKPQRKATWKKVRKKSPQQKTYTLNTRHTTADTLDAAAPPPTATATAIRHGAAG